MNSRLLAGETQVSRKYDAFLRLELIQHIYTHIS